MQTQPLFHIQLYNSFTFRTLQPFNYSSLQERKRLKYNREILYIPCVALWGEPFPQSPREGLRSSDLNNSSPLWRRGSRSDRTRWSRCSRRGEISSKPLTPWQSLCRTYRRLQHALRLLGRLGESWKALLLRIWATRVDKWESPAMNKYNNDGYWRLMATRAANRS